MAFRDEIYSNFMIYSALLLLLLLLALACLSSIQLEDRQKTRNFGVCLRIINFSSLRFFFLFQFQLEQNDRLLVLQLLILFLFALRSKLCLFLE
jgi:hypothetical protein